MGVEIERKFLVASDDWSADVRRSVRMHQGYFRTAPESTVRVRLIESMSPRTEATESARSERRGVLTIKGRPAGGVRPEFEYTIPPADVERMLDLFCGDRSVEKVRHYVAHTGDEWVVDVFEGRNEGLTLAEIELDDPDASIERPDWLGEEVTDDPTYTNAELARHPRNS